MDLPLRQTYISGKGVLQIPTFDRFMEYPKQKNLICFAVSRRSRSFWTVQKCYKFFMINISSVTLAAL